MKPEKAILTAAITVVSVIVAMIVINKTGIVQKF